MIQVKHLLIFLSSGLYGMYPEFNPQDNILKILIEQPNIHFTKDEKDLFQGIEKYKKQTSVFKLHDMKKDVDRIIRSKLKSSNQATTQFLRAGKWETHVHNKMLLNMNDVIQTDLTLCMLTKVNNCLRTVVIIGAAVLVASYAKFIPESEK